MPTQPPSVSPTRLLELSLSRQTLVRLCQSVAYGQVHELHVHAGEPVYNPPPRLIREIRLDAAGEGRLETELKDFALRSEVRRLMEQLDRLGDGCLDRIEIRAGIPWRIVVQQHLTEVPL